MRIIVTQAHIDNGEPQCASACPIALALNEQLPGGWMVDESVAHSPERGVYAKLPKEACTFIAEFDYDGPDYLEPFDMDLEFLPDCTDWNW